MEKPERQTGGPSLSGRVLRPVAVGMAVLFALLTLLGFTAAYPAAREAGRTGLLAAGALLALLAAVGAGALLLRFVDRQYLRPLSRAAEAVALAAGGDLSQPLASIPRTSREAELLLSSVEGLGQRNTDCLLEMQRVLERMAAGDLTARLGCGRAEECGGVCAALDGLSQALRGTLGSVRSSLEQTAGQFETLARETAALSQSGDRQKQARDALDWSLERLAEQLRRQSGGSGETWDAAERLLRQLERYDQRLGELAGAVDRISACAAETGTLVKDMETAAFQCSVLARTAYVEAAGAGVNGKGFAIVASELRVLASRSAQAAQAAAAVTGEVGQTIREGTALAAAVRRELQEITAGSRELCRRASDATGSQEQDMAGTLRQAKRLSALAREDQAAIQRNARSAQLLRERLDRLREALRALRIS